MMEPKLKIGDKVETNDNLIGTVSEIRQEKDGFVYGVSIAWVDFGWYKEKDLKLYVKPEKTPEDKTAKREKVIELIKAYFDGKDIIMKDPEHGVKNWVSIHDPNYWSYLGEFIREVDKYKIVE